MISRYHHMLPAFLADTDNTHPFLPTTIPQGRRCRLTTTHGAYSTVQHPRHGLDANRVGGLCPVHKISGSGDPYNAPKAIRACITRKVRDSVVNPMVDFCHDASEYGTAGF